MKYHRFFRLLGAITTLSLLLIGVVQAGELPPFGLLAWPLFPGVTHTRPTMIPTRPDGSSLALAPAWHVEAVDSGGDVGLYPSLALDAAGHPHISYLDWTNKVLKYAYYDGSSWLVEPVPGAGYIGGGATSLVLDNQGWPHIAYCAGEEGYNYCIELRYAWRDVTTWYTDTVDGGSTIGDGSGASLVLDVAGQPHIAYNGCNGLCYASYDGTAWITQTVMPSGHGVGAISLVLDAAGRPHISYAASFVLMYAHYDGTQWVFEEVAVMGQGCCTSLALDGASRPHIAYQAGSPPGGMWLNYATYDGQTWHIERVDWGQFGQYIGGGCSLALDTAERPHISYDGTELRYAHYDSTAWWVEPLEGETGSSTSLVLGTDNRAHISYYHAYYDTGDLRYASRQCMPVLRTELRGPTRLPIGATGRYTATAGPLDATPPVTLTWAGGTLGPTAVYSWTVAGPVALAVTATNACGQAHGALTVTVCLPLTGLVISGPMVLYPWQAGIFYAKPLPISATPPLTYAWDNSVVAPTSTYSWRVTGTYTLAVTATNDCGSTGAATRQVQVIGWPYSYYLPLLWRDQRGSD